MDSIVLEVETTKRSGALAFYFAGCVTALVVGVCIAAFARPFFGFCLVGLGVVGYALLLRVPFQAEYAPYLSISSAGIEYVHYLHPARKVLYRWNEIKNVEALPASLMREYSELHLFMNRPRGAVSSVYLPVQGVKECVAAGEVAAHWVATNRVSTPHGT